MNCCCIVGPQSIEIAATRRRRLPKVDVAFIAEAAYAATVPATSELTLIFCIAQFRPSALVKSQDHPLTRNQPGDGPCTTKAHHLTVTTRHCPFSDAMPRREPDRLHRIAIIELWSGALMSISAPSGMRTKSTRPSEYPTATMFFAG